MTPLVPLVFFASLAASAAPPTPLFDALPYGGWRVVGGAAAFELLPPASGDTGPVLVGRGPIPRNGFLTSPREIGDFTLEVEVRLGSPDNPKGDKMNSGIQIRSRERDARIVGLQIEVDPSARAWSGGVYDEGGRLWLAPLEGNDAARAAFKLGEWNAYEIEAIGPRIRTKVNGVPTAEWYDGCVAGLLAFQVHGGPPCEVAFRAPRIVEHGMHAWSELSSAPRASDVAPHAFEAPLDGATRGVRLRVSGRGSVVLAAGSSTVVEVPFEPVPVKEGEKPAADANRVVEIVWLDGAGAALVDGRRVAAVRCDKAPDAVRVLAVDGGVRGAERLASSR